jgi:hypothetical protein
MNPPLFGPSVIQSLLERQSRELAADCCTQAADALLNSEDGTLSVSFTFKLAKTHNAVCSTPAAGFSVRTKIDGEEDSEAIADPSQPELLEGGQQ